MPNPPKKFLSKTERQLGTGQKQYKRSFYKTPSEAREKFPDPPEANFNLRQGMTRPSSRVKKLPKEGSKKFVGPESPRVATGRKQSELTDGPIRQDRKPRGREISGTSSGARYRTPPQKQNLSGALFERASRSNMGPAQVNELLAAIVRLPKETRNSILTKLAKAQELARIPF